MLYKYYSPARIGVLENFLVRFTQPKYLNDPFECKPTIKDGTIFKIRKQAIEANDIKKKSYYVKSPNRAAKRLILKSAKRTIANINKKECSIESLREKHMDSLDNYFNDIGVLSLSNNCDIPLMWSHYTDSHKGFCIGFDEEHDFFDKFEPAFGIEKINKVYYSENRPFLELRTDKANLDDIKKKNINILCTKSKHWDYENEFRMIRKLVKPDELSGDIFLYKIPCDAIK